MTEMALISSYLQQYCKNNSYVTAVHIGAKLVFNSSFKACRQLVGAEEANVAHGTPNIR